jgi:hypothetical protein
VVAGAAGCTISPLTNRIDVGGQAFVVFVAEGPEGQTDLFAVPAEGGTATRLTFTRGAERAPSLDPAGVAVAFLLGSGRVVVMNLLNGAERDALLLPAAGQAHRIAWSRDNRRLFVRADRATLTTLAPPARLQFAPVVSGTALAAEADSMLAILVGAPPVGRVISCMPDGAGTEAPGLCVEIGAHREVLSNSGRDPVRWGADSVAWFSGDDLLVRPLGGGRNRTVRWAPGPSSPRQPTYHGGSGS